MVSDDEEPLNADAALARMLEGNARFLRGEPRFSYQPREVLADLARGQHPFATVLGCSDSRVPPELLFDAGFGELFVIRVAGNVISPEIWGSIQYAVAHLNRRPLRSKPERESCPTSLPRTSSDSAS